MARETERKFLVKNNEYKKGISGVFYKQGYLSRSPDCTIRVRTADNKAWLTIKGPTCGATRYEFEYPIPYDDALSLFALCKGGFIEKIRYNVIYDGMLWEVDEFLGKNKGLVIAEIELESENQPIKLPPWAGEEITGDARFYNSNLIDKPLGENKK
jgi:CYTH domain-containing protein